MEFLVEREDVWITSLEDKPGALAAKLAALADAGANLDFVIARRSPDRPGTGVMFVTPVRGDAELKAASEIGFSAANRLHSLRVEGANVKGLAGKVSGKLGAAGINIRGFSGAVIGKRFVLHIAFDTADLRDKAMRIIKEMT
jgi:hypothetical protein